MPTTLVPERELAAIAASTRVPETPSTGSGTFSPTSWASAPKARTSRRARGRGRADMARASGRGGRRAQRARAVAYRATGSRRLAERAACRSGTRVRARLPGRRRRARRRDPALPRRAARGARRAGEPHAGGAAAQAAAADARRRGGGGRRCTRRRRGAAAGKTGTPTDTPGTPGDRRARRGVGGMSDEERALASRLRRLQGALSRSTTSLPRRVDALAAAHRAEKAADAQASLGRAAARRRRRRRARRSARARRSGRGYGCVFSRASEGKRGGRRVCGEAPRSVRRRRVWGAPERRSPRRSGRSGNAVASRRASRLARGRGDGGGARRAGRGAGGRDAAAGGDSEEGPPGPRGAETRKRERRRRQNRAAARAVLLGCRLFSLLS